VSINDEASDGNGRKAMEENGKADKDAKAPVDVATPPPEAEPKPESAELERPSARLRAGPDLILDERLNSAAAPFLYLLAIILIAVAGYFAYTFVRG
jgi:hypothetical protein